MLITGSEEIQADASGSDQYTDYSAEAADFSTTASDLQQLDYPNADQSDVTALETTLDNEAKDASEVAADVSMGVSDQSALSQLQSDESAASKASSAVEHDLGTPSEATPTSTTTVSASTTTAAPSTTTSTPTSTTSTVTPPTSTTPPNPLAPLSLEASGTTTTEPFTVPKTAKDWALGWKYSCASLGKSGNFIVKVIGSGSAVMTKDAGVDELGDAGDGTEHYFDAGKFTLEVDSECSWTLDVTLLPR